MGRKIFGLESVNVGSLKWRLGDVNDKETSLVHCLRVRSRSLKHGLYIRKDKYVSWGHGSWERMGYPMLSRERPMSVIFLRRGEAVNTGNDMFSAGRDAG